MIPGFQWEWPARIIAWHDGDTCNADVDRGGADARPDWAIRLMRLYCPELRDDVTHQPQPGALEALQHANQLCPPGMVVVVRTKPLGRSGKWSTSSQESLGRLLAFDMRLPDGRDFADTMVADGFGSATHVPGSGDGIAGIDHR